MQVWAQNETSFGEPAGLFGVNCGHHPELFVPGATMVPEVRQDEEANAKQYAQSQKQRGLERDFRRARLEYNVAKAQGADGETLKEKQRDLKRADERLDAFAEETGRKRRREREYVPVEAKWPKVESDSPTAVRDTLREYFQGGGTQGGALTGGGGSGTIKAEDVTIYRSLGAASKNYDILAEDGSIYRYVEGTKVQDVEVFAGYRTRHPLHDGVAEGLAREFGGAIEKWQHAKGKGIVDFDGEAVRAEIHWFQEETVGQVKHRLKRWLE